MEWSEVDWRGLERIGVNWDPILSGSCVRSPTLILKVFFADLSQSQNLKMKAWILIFFSNL